MPTRSRLRRRWPSSSDLRFLSLPLPLSLCAAALRGASERSCVAPTFLSLFHSRRRAELNTPPDVHQLGPRDRSSSRSRPLERLQRLEQLRFPPAPQFFTRCAAALSTSLSLVQRECERRPQTGPACENIHAARGTSQSAAADPPPLHADGPGRLHPAALLSPPSSSECFTSSPPLCFASSQLLCVCV